MLPSSRHSGGSAIPIALGIALVFAFGLAILRSMTPRDATGPVQNPNIFNSPLVTPAPAPALADAGSSNVTDKRGTYVKVAFSAASSGSPPAYMNVMYTRKGFYRSGDLHECEQVNALVSGSATLTTLELGIQKKTKLKAGDTHRIQAGVPHLFYFEADSVMNEYWVHASNGSLCKFRAWYYKPFRRFVDGSLTDKRHAE